MDICHAGCKPKGYALCVREHSLPQSVAEHDHRIHSTVKFHAKHQGEKALILKRGGPCILRHTKKQAPKPLTHDPEKSLCASVLIVLKSLLLVLNLVLFPPLVRVSDLLVINTCWEFPPVPILMLKMMFQISVLRSLTSLFFSPILASFLPSAHYYVASRGRRLDTTPNYPPIDRTMSI